MQDLERIIKNIETKFRVDEKEYTFYVDFSGPLTYEEFQKLGITTRIVVDSSKEFKFYGVDLSTNFNQNWPLY